MNGSMRVACKDGGKIVGWYEINSMPGCPQVAVSNHAFIAPQYRNNGYGKRFHAQRLKELKDLGFNYVLCSVVSTNVFQRKILTRFGWSVLDGFTNLETNNEIMLYGKRL